MAALLRNIVLACALAMISTAASAGLFACNNTARTVSIAVGWHQDKVWVSQGWTNVAPRDCKALLIGRLANRYYYYFAESDDGSARWTSDPGSRFCTTNQSFFYRQTDGCAGELFSKLDVGDADQYTFSLTEQGSPTQAAVRCATSRAQGIDAFSKCWMNEVATSKQRQILSCIDQTQSKASLAICAAAVSHQFDGESLRVATCADGYAATRRGDRFLKCIGEGQLNLDQARAFQCAVDNGASANAAACVLNANLSTEQRRVVNCASAQRAKPGTHDGLEYLECIDDQLSEDQARILRCVADSTNTEETAMCAATGSLSSEQKKIVSCIAGARESSGEQGGGEILDCLTDVAAPEQLRALKCAATSTGAAETTMCIAGAGLSSDQRRVLKCVSDSPNDYGRAGLCAAGNNLSTEQQRLASCVLNQRSSYLQMGVCAAGANLTPEQQVFANCAISTGGQPHAFAGCVGTQLTMNELQKCMTIGIGGSGCFGDNNTATKLVRNAWKDVTEGPGPSNDLLGQDGWVGRKMQDVANDLGEGPSNTNDVVGKDGFVCRTLFGGC